MEQAEETFKLYELGWRASCIGSVQLTYEGLKYVGLNKEENYKTHSSISKFSIFVLRVIYWK